MPLSPELSPKLRRIVEGKCHLDFNWNSEPHPDSPIPELIPAEPTAEQIQKTGIVDEALRDGLHGSPRYPSLDEMKKYIDLASEVFIKTKAETEIEKDIAFHMTVGMYTGKGLVDRTVIQLLNDMRREHPRISPIVLSLATEESLKWAADCAEANDKLQVIVFMGSAPSRMVAEGWTEDYLLKNLGQAINKAANEYKLLVIGGTEHTTQTPLEFLGQIIETQVNNGAKILCIADTNGTARPIGTFRIVTYTKEALKRLGREDVRIDWHGHRDIGRSLDCAMTAIATGVNRVHLVPGGIGERTGNIPLEDYLVNASKKLKEAGLSLPWNLKKITELVQYYAEISGNPLPNHGCLGKKAFYSSLGLHVGAMYEDLLLSLEAKEKGYPQLAKQLEGMGRTVYTAVDPEEVGGKWQFGLSVWSGTKTVEMIAFLMGIEKPSSQAIQRVLAVAKRSTAELSLDLVRDLLKDNGNS